MDYKKFWKESFAGFLLKHIILAIIIFVALVWTVLIFTDKYTSHGEVEIIPDLRGYTVKEADVMLAQQGLYTQVIDSVYMRNRTLGAIIDQIPAPNSTVKRNRPVYITINSRTVRKVPLPNLTDVSFRQAAAMLTSVGLNYSQVEFTPSEYKDLVTDVKYRNQSISAGMRIPEGSSVVLVVGNGLGEEGAIVPDLIGLSLEQGRSTAVSATFIIGSINYDVPPSGNESRYVIYRQIPTVGSSLTAGSRIDIYLSKDKSRLNETENNNDSEEEFF